MREKDVRELIETWIPRLMQKHHDYGHENIGYLGLKGVFVRLWDKMWRMKNIIWDETKPEVAENEEDLFFDNFGYAIVGELLRQGKWYHKIRLRKLLPDGETS